MPYLTTADLAARLGADLYARLTDRVGGASADSAVAQQLIDEAAAESDALLAARYATPVDLVEHPELADLLAARVLDIAEYNAWKSSPFVTAVPDRVRALYDAALRWLGDVARGALPLPGAIAPAPDRAPHLRIVSAPRTLTANELDGL
jgi:phage gp36-like protein